jgi:hypothetical protein
MKLKLYVCMCMFAYSSRMGKPTCNKLGTLIPWHQKEILERSKLRKRFLGSKPGEGGFCILETKHDRRTSPRPKLFVSTWRLQEQQPQPRKTVLCSSPGEDVFCSSETKHDKITAQRTKLFILERRLQELKSETQKMSWVRVSVKMLGLGIIIIIIFVWYSTIRGIVRPTISFRAINIDKKCKHLSNFAAVTLRALC